MVERKQPSKKLKQSSQDIFDWWNDQCRFEEEDNGWVIFKKVLIRITGIILLIIFSPILIAIFLLVLAVSL